MPADGINIRITWSDTAPHFSGIRERKFITNHTIPFTGPLPPALEEPPEDYPFFEKMEYELVDTRAE